MRHPWRISAPAPNLNAPELEPVVLASSAIKPIDPRINLVLLDVIQYARIFTMKSQNRHS
jgi:hypothetical protein